MTDYANLQTRCQRGETTLVDANNLLAECHAALGRLVAEVAGLRTGYQAYERVNAELKAEVEKIDSDRKACWAEFKVQGRRLDELKADNDALRQDADRLRWLRQHEFDIGSYHGVHEHNATAWFEHISDSDIDSMIADEAQFAKEAGHE